MSVVSKENLSYFAQQFYARLKGIFVSQEAGKGLSTNDYTDEAQNKLDAIEDAAQENKIETVTFNGTSVEPDSNKNVALVETDPVFAASPAHGITAEDIAAWNSGSSSGSSAYHKPDDGIPASDMTSGVQSALTAAGTAIQSVSKTDGTYVKLTTGKTGTTASIAVNDAAIGTALAGKQDTISDLATIRRGAEAGATAIQPEALSTTLGDYATTAAMQTAINTAVASAYIYKGSVANYAALPASGQTTGWVYNVEDTGMNYAWDGSAWDALGTTLNIETLQTSEIDTIISNVFNPQSGS